MDVAYRLGYLKGYPQSRGRIGPADRNAVNIFKKDPEQFFRQFTI